MKMDELEAKFESVRTEVVDTRAMCGKLSDQSEVLGKIVHDISRERVHANGTEELTKTMEDELEKMLPACMQTLVEKLNSMVDDQLANLAVEVKKQLQEAWEETNALKSQVKQLQEVINRALPSISIP